MKTRTIKIALLGITILSIIFFITCDKKSTEPEEIDAAKHPAELIGTWYSITESYDVVITSKSNQKVVDIISEGNGSILITGDQQAELNHLFCGAEGEGILMVWVSNVPIFEIEELNFPVYFLAFHIFLDTTITHELMVTFQAYLSETEIAQYFGTLTNLDYNPTTFSLTANNLQLFKENSSTSVFINGTLTNNMVDVSASIPTTLFSFENNVLMESTISFSADGKFSRTSVIDNRTENANGTWEVSDGDSLTIMQTYKDEDNRTIQEIIDGAFTISPLGVLTVNFDQNANDLFGYYDDSGSHDEQDYIRKFEEDFFIETGSLTDVTIHTCCTFSKSTAKITTRTSIFEDLSISRKITNKLFRK